MLTTVLLVLLVSVASWALIMVAFSLSARRPGNLGVTEGRLAPCPETPNCVCSQGGDPQHAVQPLRLTGDPDAAWRRLQAAVATLPRTAVVRVTDDYLHAECTSLVFRFVDDLECLLDRDAKAIQVRSASRAGRSDLGVNRRRVEAIRARSGRTDSQPRLVVADRAAGAGPSAGRRRSAAHPAGPVAAQRLRPGGPLRRDRGLLSRDSRSSNSADSLPLAGEVGHDAEQHQQRRVAARHAGQRPHRHRVAAAGGW
ncbi:MAG: DUF1499 domain-containing protein [Gemmataceae bacterium]